MSENWREIYNQKLTTAEEAVKIVRSGDCVYVGLVSSEARILADALYERRDELEAINIFTALITRPIKAYTEKERSPFRCITPFLGPYERMAMANGRPTYYTSFPLSQLDYWVANVGKPNVAFLEVSMPNAKGFVSFGPSGGSLAGQILQIADRVVLQVNRNVPYIVGQDCLFDIEKADFIVEANDEIPDSEDEAADEVTQKIADLVSAEIPDGATLQLGIGKVSSAVGFGLKTKNELGIHTEMFCNSLMDLMKNGNVTNTYKGFIDGKSVFAFAMGSKELYKFMNRNREIYNAYFSSVNDPRIIAKNNKMMSVNTCMAIDLGGQIAADHIGGRQFSAVGGLSDFVRGAQWSKGGKSIIATPSTMMKDGKLQSKIVFSLPENTYTAVSRGDVQYVATEYGIVNLKALTVDDRVRALISLAHPQFRDELRDQAKAKHLI